MLDREKKKGAEKKPEPEEKEFDEGEVLEDVFKAGRESYDDFEDAVQMMAAVQAGAQYVVTRNVQDYKAGPLPALQPAELLAMV